MLLPGMVLKVARMRDWMRCITLAVAVMAFYLLPWMPFLIAALYFTGWTKIALAALGIIGMVGQPFLIIWWHGTSD
jgi:hypothetical protein